MRAACTFIFPTLAALVLSGTAAARAAPALGSSGRYAFTLDGAPASFSSASVAAREGELAPGDLINVEGIWLTLGSERECHFRTAREGVLLEAPEGTTRWVGVRVGGSNGVSAEPVDGMAALSEEEVHGLWGLRAESWTPSCVRKAGWLDASRVCLTLVSQGGEDLPDLPAGLRRLRAMRFVGWGNLSKLLDLEFLEVSPEKDLDLSILRGLSQLKLLQISGTSPLENIETLGELSALESLSIGPRRDVTDIGFVSRLSRLREVLLFGTGVTDLSPLSGLRQLESIDASATPVMRLPEGELPALRALNLVSTPLDAEAVSAFRRAHPLASVQDGRSVSPEYLALLGRYAGGDPSAAVDEFLSWPESRIEQERRTLRALGAEAQLCREREPSGHRMACGPSPAWAKAALMLHTDAAGRDIDEGRSPVAQRAAALAVAELVKNDTALRSFLRRWYVAVAAQAQGRTAWLDALEWADRGLKEFPEATDLRLVVASVEEVRAGLVEIRLPDVVFEDPHGDALRQSLLESEERHALLERAQRELFQLLAKEPDRVDARLRLGRISWRLGQPTAAQEALRSVLAASPGRSDAYLANLFLGRVFEEEGQLDEAVQAYSEAVSLDPQCQAARLALSHAYLKRGDSASARRWLNLAVSSGGRRAAQDAFWVYPWGPSALALTRLAALRREVVSP